MSFQFRKAVSVFTTALFLSNALVPSGWTGVLAGETPNRPGLLDVDLLRLPKDLGTVEEVYRGKSEKTVVFLQDAHAVYDSQKSIQNVIAYFQEQYGIHTFAVEGTEGRLDPTLLRAYPDKKNLKEVLDGYLKRSEISGIVSAAVLNPREGIYYGVDNRQLYEKNIQVFQQSLKRQPKLIALLEKIRSQLRAKQSQNYPPELLKIRLLSEQLENKEIGVDEFLRRTASAEGLKAFPKLSAFWAESQNRRDPATSLRERSLNFFEYLKSRVRSEKNLKHLNRDYQAFQTSQLSGSIFLARLFSYAAQESIQTDNYTDLESVAEKADMLLNMRGGEFQEELENYMAGIEKPYLKNKTIRNFFQIDSDLTLLEKLSRLELNRKQWEQIQILKSPKNFKRASDLWKINGIQWGEASPHAGIWKSYFRFYQLVEQRDQAFAFELEDLLKTRDTVLWMAGGFHKEGVCRSLKEKGISYAVVMPKTASLEGHENYFERIRGHVSWKDYLHPENGKVDVYDAFMRSVIDQLAGKLKRDEQARVFFEWKKNLELQLAMRGQLDQWPGHQFYLEYFYFSGLTEPKFKELVAHWRQNLNTALDKLRNQNLPAISNTQVAPKLSTALFQTATEVLNRQGAADSRLYGFDKGVPPVRATDRYELRAPPVPPRANRQESQEGILKSVGESFYLSVLQMWQQVLVENEPHHYDWSSDFIELAEDIDPKVLNDFYNSMANLLSWNLGDDLASLGADRRFQLFNAEFAKLKDSVAKIIFHIEQLQKGKPSPRDDRVNPVLNLLKGFREQRHELVNSLGQKFMSYVSPQTDFWKTIKPYLLSDEKMVSPKNSESMRRLGAAFLGAYAPSTFFENNVRQKTEEAFLNRMLLPAGGGEDGQILQSVADDPEGFHLRLNFLNKSGVSATPIRNAQIEIRRVWHADASGDFGYRYHLNLYLGANQSMLEDEAEFFIPFNKEYDEQFFSTEFERRFLHMLNVVRLQFFGLEMSTQTSLPPAVEGDLQADLVKYGQVIEAVREIVGKSYREIADHIQNQIRIMRDENDPLNAEGSQRLAEELDELVMRIKMDLDPTIARGDEIAQALKALGFSGENFETEEQVTAYIAEHPMVEATIQINEILNLVKNAKRLAALVEKTKMLYGALGVYPAKTITIIDPHLDAVIKNYDHLSMTLNQVYEHYQGKEATIGTIYQEVLSEVFHENRELFLALAFIREYERKKAQSDPSLISVVGVASVPLTGLDDEIKKSGLSWVIWAREMNSSHLPDILLVNNSGRGAAKILSGYVDFPAYQSIHFVEGWLVYVRREKSKEVRQRYLAAIELAIENASRSELRGGADLPRRYVQSPGFEIAASNTSIEDEQVRIHLVELGREFYEQLFALWGTAFYFDEQKQQAFLHPDFAAYVKDMNADDLENFSTALNRLIYWDFPVEASAVQEQFNHWYDVLKQSVFGITQSLRGIQADTEGTLIEDQRKAAIYQAFKNFPQQRKQIRQRYWKTLLSQYPDSLALNGKLAETLYGNANADYAADYDGFMQRLSSAFMYSYSPLYRAESAIRQIIAPENLPKQIKSILSGKEIRDEQPWFIYHLQFYADGKAKFNRTRLSKASIRVQKKSGNDGKVEYELTLIEGGEHNGMVREQISFDIDPQNLEGDDQIDLMQRKLREFIGIIQVEVLGFRQNENAGTDVEQNQIEDMNYWGESLLRVMEVVRSNYLEIVRSIQHRVETAMLYEGDQKLKDSALVLLRELATLKENIEISLNLYRAEAGEIVAVANAIDFALPKIPLPAEINDFYQKYPLFKAQMMLLKLRQAISGGSKLLSLVERTRILYGSSANVPEMTQTVTPEQTLGRMEAIRQIRVHIQQLTKDVRSSNLVLDQILKEIRDSNRLGGALDGRALGLVFARQVLGSQERDDEAFLKSKADVTFGGFSEAHPGERIKVSSAIRDKDYTWVTWAEKLGMRALPDFLIVDSRIMQTNPGFGATLRQINIDYVNVPVGSRGQMGPWLIFVRKTKKEDMKEYFTDVAAAIASVARNELRETSELLIRNSLPEMPDGLMVEGMNLSEVSAGDLSQAAQTLFLSVTGTLIDFRTAWRGWFLETPAGVSLNSDDEIVVRQLFEIPERIRVALPSLDTVIGAKGLEGNMLTLMDLELLDPNQPETAWAAIMTDAGRDRQYRMVIDRSKKQPPDLIRAWQLFYRGLSAETKIWVKSEYYDPKSDEPIRFNGTALLVRLPGLNLNLSDENPSLEVEVTMEGLNSLTKYGLKVKDILPVLRELALIPEEVRESFLRQYQFTFERNKLQVDGNFLNRLLFVARAAEQVLQVSA